MKVHSLVGGALAGIGASACCLAPLALVTEATRDAGYPSNLRPGR